MADVIQGHFGGAPFHQMEELYESVWEAIMAYEGQVSTMAVVGVLRLVEHKLLSEVHGE